MEESWEEVDVISKLLNEENFGGSVDGVEDSLRKSLHDEFLEIGEKYEVPKKRSFQDFLSELKAIDNIADQNIKQQNTTSSSGVSAVEYTPVVDNNSVIIKAVRPPPGFPEKPNGIPFAPKLVNSNSSLLGFALKQAQVSKSVKRVIKNKPSPTKKCLNDTLKEFNHLSSVMDCELSTYELKLLTMKEQKEMVLEGAREQGRVDMMKTLLYEQQEAMRKLETKHQNEIKDMKEQHQQQLQQLTNKRSDTDLQMEYNKVLNKREDEIENLNAMVHDLQCELDNHLEGGSIADLQIKFNRALDEREEEIENLNATIHDLQSELEVFQGGQDDIAMEVRILLTLMCRVYINHYKFKTNMNNFDRRSFG